jgi:hypothetical protein
MSRYLRNKQDGFIYDWHPILAANPRCEEVTEEQAFPERFVKPEVVEVVEQKRKTKGALSLETANIPEPPQFTNAELAVEAGKRWPK